MPSREKSWEGFYVTAPKLDAMRPARGQSGFTVVELLVAAAIATMLIAAATGIFLRGTRISENTADSTRIATLNAAFREFVLSDLRVAIPSQSRPHEEDQACAYFATRSRWVSYCTDADLGVYRAEVTSTSEPAQVALDEPLHPHSAPPAGGSRSTRLAGPGSSVRIVQVGRAFEATLTVPHPDPTMPASETTLRVTPRVGG